MAKVALIFPGQGSQKVGMGQDVAARFPEAQAVFDTADKVLGMPMQELIFAGSEEDLRRTENTQPAILIASIALLRAFLSKPLEVHFVAGHSLGEYSALVAAGAIAFEDAVRLVRMRGQWMEEAVPAGQGSMAAVLGAEREELGQLCAKITGEGYLVQLANLNCPGQIVVSGTRQGVEQVVQRAKEIGAKRVLPLNVSGPFHSSLMQPAAEKLAAPLEEVNISAAQIPVVANVSASVVQQPDEIRQSLIRQVASPVLWEDSVRLMIEQGVDTFVEIGPGNVLSGLVKKISRQVATYQVSDLATLESTWEALHGGEK